MIKTSSTRERWARFRFAVVGPLLAARPDHGELHAALVALAKQRFTHPVTRETVTFAFSTLERWYYQANRDDDPVAHLERKVRKDAGHVRAIGPKLAEAIAKQYAAHPTWSYLLHYQNLDAQVEANPTLGPLPSYATVRRYMKAHGWYRQRRRSDQRVQHSPREVRSFEMQSAHAMWHLDFHGCSRALLLPDGRLVKPELLAVIDDHSRVCCHAQWYLTDGAEQLVHGLCQAFMKRGLPRSIMMDNGSAMIAAETQQGLMRLGIHQAFTLVDSPHQNGKQETFFAPVEGKLIAMLEGVRQLDLDLLNRATVAWVEHDYNRSMHEGIGCAPLDRLRDAVSEGRACPSPQRLRSVFRRELSRKQRRGDGTCSILGVRFEIPSRFRHIENIVVHVASWDLSRVTLVDPRQGTHLAELFPLDKHANADGYRKVVDPMARIEAPPAEAGIAPHLSRLLAAAEATGLPAAFLPTPSTLEIENHD